MTRWLLALCVGVAACGDNDPGESREERCCDCLQDNVCGGAEFSFGECVPDGFAGTREMFIDVACLEAECASDCTGHSFDVAVDRVLGAPCPSNDACVTGFCRRVTDELGVTVSMCSVDCTGMADGAACGDIGACLIEGGDDNMCFPKCTTLAECAMNPLFTECVVKMDSGGEQICVPE